MASSMLPTRVSQSRDRYPLRWVTRSGVRSPSSAPVLPTTSASMSWVAIHATLSRSTSACSSWRSLSASWAAVILGPSAIVVFSFACLRDQTDDHEARGGRTHIQPASLATPLSPTRPGELAFYRCYTPPHPAARPAQSRRPAGESRRPSRQAKALLVWTSTKSAAGAPDTAGPPWRCSPRLPGRRSAAERTRHPAPPELIPVTCNEI